MKRLGYTLLLNIALAWQVPAQAQKKGEIIYEVNLNERADDQFKVSLKVKGLKKENNVYQFAATAPGTYQTMDIGRFVRSFKAFDRKGREIPVSQDGLNQWVISKPKKVRQISYSIAETFDTPVRENHVYEMCGTSIENDHVYMNGQAVFGYFHNLQEADLKVKLAYPSEWLIGTALEKDEDGYFLATDYDHIVDSPFLLGRLSKASSDFNGTTIDIYTYSKTDKIKSEALMTNMTSMLEAANDFVVDFPVDRYTFLFHFEDKGAGAWEHSYSSGYVLKETELTLTTVQQITSIAAHEFFHIITPLNIHSEVIEAFNFVKPTASEHLWLYEGVTEWAAHIMQLRGGLISPEQYLSEQSKKLLIDEKYFNSTYSLSKLALTSFTPEGQSQYGNIYYRGALVASLLDIRLLELSEGKRGLREVINELSKTYGPDKAFSEKDFFRLFVEATYPEIADFLDHYVRQAKPLPVKAYFAKLGIIYHPLYASGEKITSLGYEILPSDSGMLVQQPKPAIQELGLQEGDIVLEIMGEEINEESVRKVGEKLQKLEAHAAYKLKIRRGSESKELNMNMQSREKQKPHYLALDQQATAEQLKLRAIWMKNM